MAVGCDSRGGSQIAQGAGVLGQAERLYGQACAGCHEGDDRTASALEAQTLGAYEDIQQLFDYVSRTQPPDDPGSLSSADYWLTIRHLLVSREIVSEDRPVGPASVDWIDLSPR